MLLTMIKLGAIFVGFLAIHAIRAYPEHRNDDIPQMKRRLSTVRDDALTEIGNVQFSDNLQQRSLALQTNEFVHKLENGIHRLNRVVILVDEGQSHRYLPLAAKKLTDTVHEIRQANFSNSTQTKKLLEETVREVAEETNHLIEAAQHYQNISEQQFVFRDVKEIIEKLCDAIQKFRDLKVTPNRPQSTNEIVKDVDEGCMPWVKRIIEVMEKVTTYDREIEHYLAHEGYKMSNLFEHVIFHFQRESYQFRGVIKENVDDVVAKLNQQRFDLIKVLEKHTYPTIKERIEALKRQILITLQNGSAQISILCDLAKSANRAEPGNEAFYNVMQKVGSDCLNSTRRLLWKLELIAEGHVY